MRVYCRCGARDVGDCPGAWEKGCDLGANEAHAQIAEDPQPTPPQAPEEVVQRLMALHDEAAMSASAIDMDGHEHLAEKQYLVERAALEAALRAALTAQAAEVARLTAEVEGLRKDAERYRLIREASSLLKLYVYEDPTDACSGDWLYKPAPEAVDAFCDAAELGRQTNG